MKLPFCTVDVFKSFPYRIETVFARVVRPSAQKIGGT
jgi:hypothetical protein